MTVFKRRWIQRVLASAAVCAVVAVLGVRLVVVEPFEVPSASMQPLFVPGDRLLVYKVGSDSVRRGEVVVFDGRDSFAPYKGGEHYFVKRVIGVGGDRVTCCGPDGRLLVNGKPLTEDYLGRPISASAPASAVAFDVEVPNGRLWLLGDNRANSEDSRAYLGAPGGGFVGIDRVVGEVRAVYWPSDRARWLSGLAP